MATSRAGGRRGAATGTRCLDQRPRPLVHASAGAWWLDSSSYFLERKRDFSVSKSVLHDLLVECASARRAPTVRRLPVAVGQCPPRYSWPPTGPEMARLARLAALAQHLRPSHAAFGGGGDDGGGDDGDGGNGGNGGEELGVAEAVMTVILASDPEDRADGLAKLLRVLERGDAKEAATAVEAGAVEALAPLASRTGAVGDAESGAVAAALLGHLGVVTADASAAIVRLGLGSARALTPPASMKVAESATRPSVSDFAALCGAACAGPQATAAVAAEVSSSFLLPVAGHSEAAQDATFRQLLGALEADAAGPADGFTEARQLGRCHALRLLVAGDPIAADCALAAGLEMTMLRVLELCHGAARPLLWSVLALALAAVAENGGSLAEEGLLALAVADLDALQAAPAATDSGPVGSDFPAVHDPSRFTEHAHGVQH
eukprot:SAG22_NODE_49_length_24620_cov_80.053587_12_plen_434_part_00